MHNCIRLSNPIVNVKIETTAVETVLGLGYVNYSPNILHLRHKSGNYVSVIKRYFQILVRLIFWYMDTSEYHLVHLIMKVPFNVNNFFNQFNKSSTYKWYTEN